MSLSVYFKSQYFFDRFLEFAGDVVLIAAAGNNRSKVAYPAAFENIIAVGSYHFSTLYPISKYNAVPSGRYILGPDGSKVAGEELASRSALRRNDLFYGTSFSTAFVSGVCARIICGLKGGGGLVLMVLTQRDLAHLVLKIARWF